MFELINFVIKALIKPMNQLKSFLLSLSIFFALSASTQQTMMTEVSYEYLQKLIATAKQNYPRVKIHDGQIQIAQTNVKRARISWFDMLNLSYFYSPNIGVPAEYFNPYMFTRYQLGVGINIGSILQKPSEIKIAKLNAQNTQFQKDEYFLTLEKEVKQRYYAYIQQLTVLRLRLQALQDAEVILQSVRSKYEKGEETFEHYNTALTAHSNQSQQKIGAETEMLIAKATLEELIVSKLEDIK
jgi:outer membrane protein TolC